VVNSVASSWTRLVGQLRDAGVDASRIHQALVAVTCCQPEIGLTPLGVPFTAHAPGCRGLEERLAVAVFEVPTDTEQEMEAQAQRMAELSRRLYKLTGTLRKLSTLWRSREKATSGVRSEAYQLGAANAWATAAAELDESLDPGVE
jgi:hypothetical protein